jgi:hypothetical protein
MALGGGGRRLRRIIELILDAASTKRAERGMQDALRRGTDPKAAARNLGVVQRSLAGLSAAARLLITGGGLALFFRKIITESAAAQATQAQLAAAIESTGGAAGRSVQQLNEHAQALQRVTTFGDDAIGSAQALLLTFTRVRGEQFDAATKSVLDLATAMGGGEGGLKSAALQVGKALQDPIRGVTALRRAGIQLSQAQTDLIKKLVQTGDVAAAQTIILKELQVQFGGSAEAARDTLGGALAGLNNAWGDAFEVSQSASAGIVGAINDMANAIPAVRGVLDRFFLRIQELAINAAVNFERLRVVFRTYLRDWAIANGATQETIDGLNERIESAKVQLLRMEEAAVEMMAELYAPPSRTGPSVPRRLAQDAEDATAAVEKLTEAERLRLKFLQQETPEPEIETGRVFGRGLGELAKEKGVQPPGEIITTPGGPKPDTSIAADTLDAASMVESAAEGVRSVWDELFGSMQDGADRTGIAFYALAEAINGSMSGAFARIAEMEANQSLARALSEGAKGLGALAVGNFAAAGLHAQAAAQHMAAFAAWKVAGGVAGGGGDRGGGGAGGFGVDNSGGRLSSAADRAEQIPPEINIFMDPWDPDNPQQVRVAQRFIMNAREAYGENQKPTVRRYSYPRGTS